MFLVLCRCYLKDNDLHTIRKGSYRIRLCPNKSDFARLGLPYFVTESVGFSPLEFPGFWQKLVCVLPPFCDSLCHSPFLIVCALSC
jgi:hypothetical protein